ncbi:MAG: hypothetical protein ACOC5S_03320 [Acidobacteriota bacterium]
MNSNKSVLKFLVICLGLLSFSWQNLISQEIFIFRQYKNKKPLFEENKLSFHGEFFGQLQLPSTFPSYNDLSGPEDRWNFGFRNLTFFTENSSLLIQLVTHDDGRKRTKFDWHFSLRYLPGENFVFIWGHDSNHDSDHRSILNGRTYYLNRNYAGLGFPFTQNSFYIEPFTWILFHTNQRGHLDLSGNKLIQEYGIRMGVWFEEQYGLSAQFIGQSEALFSLGQAFLGDVILRVKIISNLEFSLGGSFWVDIQESCLGNKKTFCKLFWGLAIPFG